MHNFTDIDHLKLYLSKDITSNSICPIRFLNIETMNDWVNIKSYLEQLCPQTIFISNFCEDTDVIPNLRQMNALLRKLDKSALLVPLSEHLRINNQEAEKILSGLINMQFINGSGNNLKIYIPLYRMKSLLNTLTTNPRHNDSIIYLQNMADVDYSLTIVQDTLNVDIEGNTIKGYKDYLVYWEQNPDKPIILHTQNAVHFRDIIVSDNVKVIVTAYDLLKQYYYIPESIKPEWGDETMWKFLLSKYSHKNSLDNIIAKTLSVRDFDNSLFTGWKAKNDNTKWLIWLWAKINAKTEYLKIIMQKSTSYIDLPEAVFNGIFDCLGNLEFFSLFAERYNLIKDIGITPAESFWAMYAEKPTLDKIKVLTNLTEKEQVELFLNLSSASLNDSVLNIIHHNHPLVSAYLMTSEFENTVFTDYFYKYKLQKLMNEIDPVFLTLVDSLANAKCEALWQLPSRNALIEEIYDDKSIILYVDAFGVEYCSLLKHLLEIHGFYVAVPAFGHCNIPSTTLENKDFIVGKNAAPVMYSLDKLKHDNTEYPNSIIKEFHIIEEIRDKIIELLSDDVRQVILSSDHGASRLAVLANGETFTICDNVKKYKYGRYCIDSENDYANYNGCVNKDDYWIFANYNRFSSQGAPLNETHGGATLEECVVPVISIQKKVPDFQQDEKITITWYSQLVNEMLGNTAQLEFTLSKQQDNVIAVIGGKRYPCTINDCKYYVTHTTTKETTYTARIVAKGIIGDITYTVVKGNSINPNFDL